MNGSSINITSKLQMTNVPVYMIHVRDNMRERPKQNIKDFGDMFHNLEQENDHRKKGIWISVCGGIIAGVVKMAVAPVAVAVVRIDCKPSADAEAGSKSNKSGSRSGSKSKKRRSLK